ncbi:hypothetical protein [Pandoraea sp.]|uniref:hypothetical protein n=1 Tax=Pandoraea sp. TaxID=1883445 RepID=UPI0035B1349B
MNGLSNAALAIARVIEPTCRARRDVVSARWRQEILQGFIRGDLRLRRSDDRRPIYPDQPGAVMTALVVGDVTVTELNRWLSSIGTDVQVCADDFRPETPARRQAAGDAAVRETASRLADAWARERFDMTGSIPSEDAVSKGIARDLNATFTQDWSPRTIRRHSLREWRFSVLAQSAQIAQDGTV